MKSLSDIGRELGLPYNMIQEFIKCVENETDIKVKNSFMDGKQIDDNDVAKAIEAYEPRLQKFRQEQAEKEKIQAEIENKTAQKQAEKAQMMAEKNKALSEMLVSSGFNFDGYKIVKYSGYISGDDTVQINRKDITGNYNPQNVCDALVKIRIQALKELKEAAYELGCNAVIGVDFDYMTFDPTTVSAGTTYYYPYVICVTANGNAVVIEKE